jgi:hypothetical protein
MDEITDICGELQARSSGFEPSWGDRWQLSVDAFDEHFDETTERSWAENVHPALLELKELVSGKRLRRQVRPARTRVGDGWHRLGIHHTSDHGSPDPWLDGDWRHGDRRANDLRTKCADTPTTCSTTPKDHPATPGSQRSRARAALPPGHTVITNAPLLFRAEHYALNRKAGVAWPNPDQIARGGIGWSAPDPA